MEKVECVAPFVDTVHFSEGCTVHEYNYANIYLVENFLDDELCDELVRLYNCLPTRKNLYGPGNNVECFSTTLSDWFNVDDAFFYEFDLSEVGSRQLFDKVKRKEVPYNNNLNGTTHAELYKVNAQLMNMSKRLKRMFKPIQHKICFAYPSGFILRKIFGPTRLHIDGLTLDKAFNKQHLRVAPEDRFVNMDSPFVRNCTAVFTLSDHHEGGDFCFPNCRLSLKLTKGSLLLFPPYWTHPHYTTELLNNTYRYTMTCWYGARVDMYPMNEKDDDE
jgi:hypothetical protein